MLADRGVSQTDNQARLELYQKAIALDSSFALAWAALSGVHDAIYWFYQDRTPARSELAREAAERAIRLQPDLAEGHVALGFNYYHGSLDYDRALQELERARQLQPSNSDVYQAMGAVHRRQGKWSEAMADLTKSAALNPRSAGVLSELGITQAWMRAYPEAERSLERAMQLAPDRSARPLDLGAAGYPVSWGYRRGPAGAEARACRCGPRANAAGVLRLQRVLRACGRAQLRLRHLAGAAATLQLRHRHHRILQLQGCAPGSARSSRPGAALPRLRPSRPPACDHGSSPGAQVPCPARHHLRRARP